MKVYNILTKVYCTANNKSGFIPLNECLKLIASNGPIDVFTETASFSVFENQTPIMNEMDWGNLDILIAEMEEAIRRINEHQLGIVRHASMEGAVGLYLVFVPAGNQIKVKLFGIGDNHPMYMCFPIPGIVGEPGDIYSTIESCLSETNKDEEITELKEMPSFVIETEKLTALLHREILTGKELFARLQH